MYLLYYAFINTIKLQVNYYIADWVVTEWFVRIPQPLGHQEELCVPEGDCKMTGDGRMKRVAVTPYRLWTGGRIPYIFEPPNMCK